MSKRTWMVLALALGVSILVLSACGSGDLAKDLTPIPTLPAGEEPVLKEVVTSGDSTVPEATSASDTGGTATDELVALGQTIFSGACGGCHGAQAGAGPALTGMATRAAERVEGLSAEEYLRQAIVEPGAFVVDGFANIMPPTYGEQYDDKEIDALVAYIMANGGDGTAETTEESEEVDEDEEDDEQAAEPNPENGERLFATNCSGCHGAQDGAGPALTGMGEAAKERVEGMSAEEYLHESIVDPSAFVVEGFSDFMPKQFGDQFSDAELSDIVAYILEQ